MTVRIYCSSFLERSAMYEVLTIQTKKDNSLNQAALDKLLARLDDDRERAAEVYERLRKAMIAFFEFRGSRNPHEDTDETINRVARRLSEGQVITTSNPASYFYAVARNVWRERLAETVTETELNEDLPSMTGRTLSPLDLLEQEEEQQIHEWRLACLEECLQELSSGDRELITAYYQGEGRAKIEARRELASRLAISISALRIKACRIRDKLEEGVSDRLRAKMKSRE